MFRHHCSKVFDSDPRDQRVREAAEHHSPKTMAHKANSSFSATFDIEYKTEQLLKFKRQYSRKKFGKKRLL